MTTAMMQKARLGKSYWQEYVRLNGYAFSPTRAGIAKLARLLDLTQSHVRECVHLYLDA